MHPLTRAIDDRHLQQPQYFKDMVSYTGKIVGKIDANLDSLGLREDTLLLFIGDNGTATSVINFTPMKNSMT
jgi:arylsulfatase A